MSSRSRRRGFSILELIVVLLVLGILAAIAVPTYNTVQGNSLAMSVKATADALARDSLAAARSDGFRQSSATYLNQAVAETTFASNMTWNAGANALTGVSGNNSRTVTLTLDANGFWRAGNPTSP